MKLRPYQESAINCLYARLKAKGGNTCIVLPTAAGKTAVMAQICKDAVERFGIRVAILTHVKELIAQGHKTLTDYWPEAPVGLYSAGLGIKMGDMPIVIGGIQSIFRNPSVIGRRDLILVDECFVAGTMVSTPNGKTPIEQIKKGDIVKTALGDFPVLGVSCRMTCDYKTLEFHDGKKLECTGNHRIFTGNSGWATAEDIGINATAYREQDLFELQNFVLSMEKRNKYRAESQVGKKKVLFKIMRGGRLPKSRSKSRRKKQAMRTMRKNILSQKEGIELVKQKVLLSKLCGHSKISQSNKKNARKQKVPILREPVSSVECDKRRQDYHPCRQGMAKAKILLNILLEEACESNVEERNKRCGFSQTQGYRTQTSEARRKRLSFARIPTKAIRNAWRWVEGGISDSNKDGERFWLSDMLQGRYWESKYSSRNRNRRRKPRPISTKRKGQEEGQVFGGVKLVRSSNNKSSSAIAVYNLHVAGHPSYFANGLLVHNCQLLSDDQNSMYGKVLEYMRVASEKCRVVGLTATPYRMTTGMVYGEGKLLDDICYEIGVKTLVEQGYLCKIRAKGSAITLGMEDAKIRGGEFVMETITANDEVVDAACKETLRLAVGRRSIIVFCCLVEHAIRVRDKFVELGESASVVYGDMPSDQRDEAISDFLNRKTRIITNVNVLAVGFDAPAIDCVVMLRPTMSGGLYYQQIGRGFRLHPDKADCILIDFAMNTIRHGAVDEISRDGRPKGDPQMKRCVQCNEIVPLGVKECECGYVFSVEVAPRKPRHATGASDIDPLTGGKAAQEEEEVQYAVKSVRYSLHRKRENKDSVSMRVTYEYGFCQSASEWICIEHDGRARDNALRWWFNRCAMLMPDTVEEAVAIGEHGMLSEPEFIVITKEGKYDRVRCVNLAPPRREASDENIQAALDTVWNRPPDKPAPGSLEEFIAPLPGWEDVTDEQLTGPIDDEVPF